jgi:four helix bundle protein
MKTFRDLKVWQKAHELTLAVYKATHDFPTEEKYGLCSQIRRAAASVPTNIVEGFKRKGNKEFARFLNIADGSLEETKYHLILSFDLGYLYKEEYERIYGICDEVGRMLRGLERSIASIKY